MNESAPVPEGALSIALNYLTEAIALLDQAGAPPQIAAHVDLAVHQLQEALTGVGPTVWPTAP